MSDTKTFKTYEQKMAERNAADRMKAQSRINATPQICAYRETDGVRLKVTCPTAAMLPVLASLDMPMVHGDGVPTYGRTFATPTELQIAQDALRGFFGR